MPGNTNTVARDRRSASLMTGAATTYIPSVYTVGHSDWVSSFAFHPYAPGVPDVTSSWWSLEIEPTLVGPASSIQASPRLKLMAAGRHQSVQVVPCSALCCWLCQSASREILFLCCRKLLLFAVTFFSISNTWKLCICVLMCRY